MENQNEIWKDIEGYEGLYQISNLGRVKSCSKLHSVKKGGTYMSKERILVPGKDKEGYLHVRLSKNWKVKLCKIHRLVALAFIPNPENYPIINHIDEIKTNNCVNNLEWCSFKYNINYSRNRKKLKNNETFWNV